MITDLGWNCGSAGGSPGRRRPCAHVVPRLGHGDASERGANGFGCQRRPAAGVRAAFALAGCG